MRKKTTRTRKLGAPIAVSYREKKSVRITEADNGYTVCTYGPNGEQSMVAKSHTEALRHVKTLLGDAKPKK